MLARKSVIVVRVRSIEEGGREKEGGGEDD